MVGKILRCSFCSMKDSLFFCIFADKLNELMSQQYPSVLLEKAVGEFAKLPGIGRKTAMRLG